MPKKGIEVKAKEEQPQQAKVIYSVPADGAVPPKTFERPPRPGFGTIVFRLIVTNIILSTLTIAALVFTYYVAHKGGIAQQWAERLAATYVPKGKDQLKIFSFLMVGVAFLHTFLSHIITLIGKTVSLRKGINLSAPRSQVNDLTGFTARAFAAHLNAHEAFPGFAAGVIVAILSGVPPLTVASLSLAFVVFRSLYFPTYWFNIPPARTFFWLAGWLCTVALYVSILNPTLLDAPPAQWVSHIQKTLETFPGQFDQLRKTVTKEL